MNILEVRNVRKYKAGYEIRTELIDAETEDNSPPFETKMAYTPDGKYIGRPKWAYRLCKKRGIKPEYRTSTSNVCSIGFCENEQKWYGWSHRAIYGFGIGDVVKEGDCTASSGWTEEYLTDHPEADISLPIGFEAKSLEDAKLMACAFADSVS